MLTVFQSIRTMSCGSDRLRRDSNHDAIAMSRLPKAIEFSIIAWMISPAPISLGWPTDRDNNASCAIGSRSSHDAKLGPSISPSIRINTRKPVAPPHTSDKLNDSFEHAGRPTVKPSPVNLSRRGQLRGWPAPKFPQAGGPRRWLNGRSCCAALQRCHIARKSTLDSGRGKGAAAIARNAAPRRCAEQRAPTLGYRGQKRP